jgi:hypothetical protein
VALVTCEDIASLYCNFLGGLPENMGTVTGRLGREYAAVYEEISNSAEAKKYAETRQTTRAPCGPGAVAAFCGVPQPPVGPIAPPPPPPGTPPPPPPPPPGLGGPIEAILRWLGERLDDVGRRLEDFRTGPLAAISAKLVEVGKAIDAARGAITSGLAIAIGQLANAAIVLAEDTLRKSGELLSGFLENAADVTDVAGAFVDAVSGQKGGILGFIGSVGADLLAPGVRHFLEGLEREEPMLVESLVDRVTRAEGLDPDVRAMFGAMRERNAPVWAFIIPFIAAGAFGGMVGSALSPETELVRQWANERKPIQLPSPAELAAADARGVISGEGAERIAVLQGFAPEPYRLLRELARSHPPPGELTDAWRRGTIQDGELDTRLAVQGFDPRAREILKSLAFIVTPPQDAIRFAVREVYDPERRRELTLDADLPPRFLDEARKAGVPEQLARDYWAAHWELPSPAQVFEMMHRRVRKIDGTPFTPEDVRKYLVAADVAPFWRPLLEQISFAPLTRVDVRRMRKVDVLSKAEVESAYLDLGYDAGNARRLADFVELDVKGEKRIETADLTAGLRSRIVTAVVNGTISEERGRSWLAQLEADPEDVELLIAEARELRSGRRADRIRELVEQLYVRGRWTLDEARTELRRRGFTDDEVRGIAEEIQLERRLREPEERVLADRDLTKAEILDARDDAIVADAQARSMLAELRYDAEEVDLMIELRDYKREQRELNEEIEVVHRRLVAGKITEDVASADLDRLAIPAAQRNRLLLKWDAEIRAKSVDLGYGTVGELVKRRLMPEGEARSYLVRLGYDERESTLSLALWGVQAAEAAARAQTAAERAAAKKAADAAAKAERERAAAAKEAARQRDLTTGQLVAAFKRGVLTEAQLRAELIGLRYSQQEATTIIETAKRSMPRST